MLPDPRGTLSTSLPPTAIVQANAEVRKSLDDGKQMKQRGSYHQYSPKMRAAIGRYASTNEVSAASHFFSGKLKHHVSTSTVLSIKKSYTEERKRCEREDDGYCEVQQLPWKPRGRPLVLGDVDNKVQLYLKKVRESGGAVNSRIAMSAAWGLLLHFNPSMLKENGGHIELSRNWTLSLLERMKFVKRKATTAQSKESVADFLERKQAFLREVVTTVEMEDVQIELVLNWDQTGIKIVPTSNWTMELSGPKRVEMSALTDK